MQNGCVRTVHRDGRWTVAIDGHTRDIVTYSTKEDALSAGRVVAKGLGVEHLVIEAEPANAEAAGYHGGGTD
jgi:hypothetical protein